MSALRGICPRGPTLSDGEAGLETSSRNKTIRLTNRLIGSTHMAICYQSCAGGPEFSAEETHLFPSWINLMMLTFEAQQAIWLRTMRLAAGGAAAEAEASRMVSEKVVAGAAATRALLGGASADRVVKGYRRKVRANIKRLSRDTRKGRPR